MEGSRMGKRGGGRMGRGRYQGQKNKERGVREMEGEGHDRGPLIDSVQLLLFSAIAAYIYVQLNFSGYQPIQ